MGLVKNGLSLHCIQLDFEEDFVVFHVFPGALMAITLSFDIGSNSVGSAWINSETGEIFTGLSIFPAGVDETDDKRGDPKNAKRRMVRRTRITLARRARRKRDLRLKLIEAGLLPTSFEQFKSLLEATDPWELRRRGLEEQLSPHELGRVFLHLAQRRGALGLKIAEDDGDEDVSEDGKVKESIRQVKTMMGERQARSFGEFIAILRCDQNKIHPITSPDCRPIDKQRGERVFRDAVRNKGGTYQHCADREMIRDEFTRLWETQKQLGGETRELLTESLRLDLDNPQQDTLWRHRGSLFGQRRQSWDLGTLGRCSLEPTERCVPHADRDASRYLVVEFINNLRIQEKGFAERTLTAEERNKIKQYLSGPLGTEKPAKRKGKVTEELVEKSKSTVSITDLRKLMGWGVRSKSSSIQFNIELDPDRKVNTDWFSREIIHGVYGAEAWKSLPESSREGINRALLKLDPAEEDAGAKLRKGAVTWGKLDEAGADRLIAAWRRRPNPQAKRLSMGRRAVRNLLSIMDREESWPDEHRPGQTRWLTSVEARRMIAKNPEFRDLTTGQPLDEHTKRRYLTGAKGATARDRHYLKKHVLKSEGEPIFDQFGKVLSEPPPAPMLSNPVARKSIHEVRRHLVEYLTRFGCRPDYVFIELSREVKMGKKDADRALFRNRLRNRIRNEIIEEFGLHSSTGAQQRAAVDRVILAVQQREICPMCGQAGLTPRVAAKTNEAEIAHIVPRGAGGENGFSNIVLSHTKCNRDMKRRTPRAFWTDSLTGGFDQGMGWIEKIYTEIPRPKFGEIKSATGQPLWSCYFDYRDDQRKIEQFKKDVKDVQTMTARQDAATKYATRQIMSYLSDALFDGQGLPERSDKSASEEDRRRKIYATDGRWTARLRREWGMFFDPHGTRNKGITNAQEHERKEKDRGDHRHHAIDAILISLSDRPTQLLWEQRERQAEEAGVNTADEEQMNRYRRDNPLPVPLKYRSLEDFHRAVRKSVYGTEDKERSVSHRATKRKLIGAMHEETLFGPVLNETNQLTTQFTGREDVADLKSLNLRLPEPEKPKQAISRLAARKQRLDGTDLRAATKWAKGIIDAPGYHAKLIDPPPGKSGLIRDIALRIRLRECLEEVGLNPDTCSEAEIKRFVQKTGFFHKSGVPIKAVVLLRTINDPVVVDRVRPEYVSNNMVGDRNPNSKRVYVGGNNHHIEIRVNIDNKKKETITGVIVTAYEAAQRKLAKHRAMRDEGVPTLDQFKRLSRQERKNHQPALRAAELSHPIIDRRDDPERGGQFLMSLSEGETLWMKHKLAKQLGYYIVAELEKAKKRIVLVPHWDSRKAGGRKDSENRPVAQSKRDEFTISPSEFRTLAPPGRDYITKVRVSPLGNVSILEKD
jgi:CRISPR-associated endonuclease Csn1